MSRHNQTIRVRVDKRSTPRPVLESLEIPENTSSRTSTCSLPRTCQKESPCRGQLSIAASYEELFCTTQTCSNSESCLQICPDICSHGLKEVERDDSQCSETCHSHVIQSRSTKFSTTHSTSCTHDPKPTSDNNVCPAAVPIITVRQSSSFARLLSLCCSSNKSDRSETPRIEETPTDKSSSAGAPIKSSLVATSTPTKPIQEHEPDETKYDDPLRGIDNVSENPPIGTPKIPDTIASGNNTSKTESSSQTPKLGNITCWSDLAKEESTTSDDRKADPRNKSAVKTDFRVPEANTQADPKMLDKVSNPKDSEDLYLGAGMKSPPPIKKKCPCHFPPAYNQYGCTGNIAGNCNCTNSD